MIKLRVDDETAIPLSVDSSSAVSMTVSEAFIDRGGAAIQNNKNAAPSTSQVVVTPDEGFDGMAKVTVAAMPQGEIDPASLSYDTYLLRGRITAEANVTQAGYVPTGANVAMEYCDELLPTENPKTVTPTTSEQTAVSANKWTKGAIKVGPIPSEYIVPTGTKSIAANGTGIDVKSYEKVDVAVPGVVPSGTLAIATNGSHDVTNYATASVAVPASAVDSGTKSITANGNGQDVVGYAAVNVNVPNSYAAADEGKVVQSGALVAQTSDTVTANDTYDTTLINSLTVNVSGGGQVYTGTVELQNEDVNNLIIPVDISSGSAVVVAYVDRTGTIVDGNVVYDDEPIMPASSASNRPMIWYVTAIKQCDNKNMKRDASNYTSIKRPYNMSYCYAFNGGNGSALALDVNIVSGTTIKLPSQNIGRFMCMSGYYARWAYTVVVA